MVKEKEIAILFERVKKGNYLEEFKPIDIIEGYYDENLLIFTANNGNVYPHITDPINNGSVYGARISILNELAKYKNIGLDKIKNIFLSKAKDYIFIKYEEDYQVILVDKKNSNIYTFKDKDSELFKNPEIEEEHLSNKILEINNKSLIENKKDYLPDELYTKLKEIIVGQDSAIKKIVTTIYLNQHFKEKKKNNLLVIGPTGVGKTYIFEELAKLLNVPLTIFSVPGMSQTGYVGKDTDDVLRSLLINSNYDIDKASNGIVILDEIDKIAFSGSKDGSISTEAVQNELLKLIEGDIRTVKMDDFGKKYLIDTSNITFVGVGAFQELYTVEKKNSIGFGSQTEIEADNKINTEKLVKYGIKKELLGRLPVLVELNPLLKDDLINILKNQNGEFAKTLKIINKHGIELSNIDFIYDLIATNAISKNLGARGIITTLNNIFLDILYYILSNPNKYNKLVIGNNILNDRNDWYLVEKTKKLQKIKKYSK